ncbi:ADAMTS-like protein 2 isoform X2 [Hyla sarda]|uniref:ADAMTS-like protein 2 isoform X2 n=1 Tax=Hyla sarda TaxID=327740 RepID=UPI0024C37B70|nr:ADAMTS-like protein 2 isoform X2 [Hyla sarda]
MWTILSSEVWDEDVTEWWGEWSSWSTCSRTCGGGVMTRERHCLRQRLQTIAGLDNTVCGGQARQYQLCQEQFCPAVSASFKQYQCSAFNAKAFGKLYHRWIPLYPDDYTSISSKPCDLQCTSTTRERQLLVPAHDGTSCRDRTYQGVCISGKCEPVGCDGKLYSSRSLDRCGVCGGDGSACYRVSGNFRKSFLGYALITTIPAGSFDILITEKRNTENILALADSAGNFYINGNMMMDNPQNFRVAGTLVKYRRPPNVHSEGLEYLTTPGPTNQSLSVMYYNFNGKIPHITYEYTAPRAPEAPESIQPLPQAPSKVQSGGASKSDSSLPGSPDTYNWGNPEDTDRAYGHGEGTPKEQEILEDQTDGLQPSTEAPRGFLSSELWRLCDQHSHPALCQSLLGGGPGGPTLAESTQEAEHLRDALMLTAAYEHLGSLSLTEAFQAPGFSSELITSHDISRADMYRWKVSAYSPCSSTCSSGLSSAFALCIRYDGREVDESHCDPSTKPEPTQEFCTGRECMPRWESSGWSECSKSCGQGVQVRSVRCWKMLAPGLDSSVYDEQCESAQLPKPPQKKVCKNKPCGPQWEFSDWSECSAACGTERVMTREVKCSAESSQCDESIKPPSEKPCLGPPCDHHWTTTEWGPCTKTCGSGHQLRDVKCYQGDELSQGCDLSTKPESRQVCNTGPCPTDAPDENCEDKTTANCSLVLKLKLCSHWYYQKACCRACGGKAS